jgi:hypothetical protein
VSLALRILAIVALLIATLTGFAIIDNPYLLGWLALGVTLAVASELPWGTYFHRT